MKSIVYCGLAMVVIVSCISARASDTAAQAAARAALEQKLNELEPTPAQPAPRKSSWDTVEPTNEPAGAETNTVQSKPTVQQATPAATAAVTTPPAPVADFTTTTNQPSAPAKPKSEPASASANIVQQPVPVRLPAPAATVVVTAPPVSVANAAPTKPAPKPAATIPVVKKPSSTVPAKPAIVTTYGTVYKNAEVEKVEPDGIIISYTTDAGGMGMTKVYFSDLPESIRRQYR